MHRPIATSISLACLLGAVLASPALTTPEKAGRYYEDALGRYERGDIAGSVIQLKNTLQEDKSMLAAQLLLGKALYRSGDLKGAQTAFETALQQGVNPSEVIIPLGQVYLALGQPETVIARAPASGLPLSLQVDVLAMRGTAHAELGNTALARQSFEAARALDPKSAVPLIAEVPVMLSAGQMERARQLAAQAVELEPKNAYAWNMQASVLHTALNLAGALAAYDKALTLDPALVDARVARAGLLLDLNREADAAKDLAWLQRQANDDPRAAYLRAIIASRHGDTALLTESLGAVTKLVDALPSAWLARREQLLMVGALAHHGLGNLEKAHEYLEILLKRNSRNAGARKLLATIHIARRNYAQALQLLEDLQRDSPDDPQMLYLMGTAHLALRHYQQASQLLERASGRLKSNELGRTLAYSQLGLGQYELGRANLEKTFATVPGDTQAGITLATLYMRNGDSKKALQTAELMAKQAPDNLTALNFLGSIKAANGDKTGARAVFNQVLARQAGFLPAVLNLAKIDTSERRYEAARKRLSDSLTKYRDEPNLLYELALVEYQAGQADAAIRYLQKAAEVQRRDPKAGLTLVDFHLAQNQVEPALAAARELLAKFPDSLPAQLTLARCYLARGDTVSAGNILQTATRRADFDTVNQLRIARLQLQAANPDGALYSVQKALQGTPDDPEAMAMVVEIESGRSPAKADEALRSLSSRHPNHVVTALAAGDLAMARRQYPQAITAYRSALARSDTTDNALKLVQAQIAAGEATKAVDFLLGWVGKHPQDLLAIKALAEAQYRAGQLANARQSYAKAIAQDPADAGMLNNYANLLLELNAPEAQGYAEKALKLVPGNPAYTDTLGWILVKRGQLEPGLRYLREARLRSPESGEIRFHLAYALARTGRKAEARDEIRAALTVPARIERTEAVARLQQELGI